MPSGDLFSVANAVSALVNAPVTIEDYHSRVLAFSASQDNVDEARTQTVLGKHTPTHFLQSLDEAGVFAELRRSREPVFAAAAELNIAGLTLSRAAICIRAGDEVLGYMWAAVPGRLSEELAQIFVDSAELVALHMLHDRAGSDVDRRLRAELVATVLDGGRSASEAARRLGIRKSAGIVMALGINDNEADFRTSHVAAQLDRLGSAFSQHLLAMYPGSATAQLGGTVYGVLPAIPSRENLERRAEQIAATFIGHHTTINALVGIGRIAEDARGLPRSRDDADRALQVLRSGDVNRSVAMLSDVFIEALLLDLREMLADREEAPIGPVARLQQYDDKNGTALVATLRAWLDCFGDVTAAAGRLHVHPNTFRYRLRRLAEVGEFQLDDPNARFAAMLQLRLSAEREA